MQQKGKFGKNMSALTFLCDKLVKKRSAMGVQRKKGHKKSLRQVGQRETSHALKDLLQMHSDQPSSLREKNHRQQQTVKVLDVFYDEGV